MFSSRKQNRKHNDKVKMIMVCIIEDNIWYIIQYNDRIIKEEIRTQMKEQRHNGIKEKMKRKGKLMGNCGINTPLGRMDGSKMSGEESPLGVCSHNLGENTH